MNLIAHPDWPAKAVTAVEVEIVMTDSDDVSLCYRVHGSGSVARPQWVSPARGDDLWMTTCFELFLKPFGAETYLEFNFSPSGRWAAYRFDGYRAGRRDFDPEVMPFVERAPDLEPGETDLIYALDADVDLRGTPPGRLRMGLSAVIEEADGTKSYWALAHPPGKPDFHDPACFAAELPAAKMP